jgi:hypothetical protein
LTDERKGNGETGGANNNYNNKITQRQFLMINRWNSVTGHANHFVDFSHVVLLNLISPT